MYAQYDVSNSEVHSSFDTDKFFICRTDPAVITLIYDEMKRNTIHVKYDFRLAVSISKKMNLIIAFFLITFFRNVHLTPLGKSNKSHFIFLLNYCNDNLISDLARVKRALITGNQLSQFTNTKFYYDNIVKFDKVAFRSKDSESHQV